MPFVLFVSSVLKQRNQGKKGYTIAHLFWLIFVIYIQCVYIYICYLSSRIPLKISTTLLNMTITLFCHFDRLLLFMQFWKHYRPALLVRGMPLLFPQLWAVAALYIV